MKNLASSNGISCKKAQNVKPIMYSFEIVQSEVGLAYLRRLTHLSPVLHFTYCLGL